MEQLYTHDGSRLLAQIGEKGVLDSADGTATGAPLNSPAARFFTPSGIAVTPDPTRLLAYGLTRNNFV